MLRTLACASVAVRSESSELGKVVSRANECNWYRGSARCTYSSKSPTVCEWLKRPVSLLPSASRNCGKVYLYYNAYQILCC